MLYELDFAGFVLCLIIQKSCPLHARGGTDEIRGKWEINI